MRTSFSACFLFAIHSLLIALAAALCPGQSAPPAANAADVPPPAPTAASLRPRFAPGRTSRYEIWSHRTQHARLTFMGQSEEAQSVMETTGQVSWIVDRVSADGTATCVMTFDWLAMTMTGEGGPAKTCDSRRAKGDVQGLQNLLVAIAGVPLTVEVAADGKVTGIRGVNAVAQRAGKDSNTPDDLDFIESASDLAVMVTTQEAVSLGKSWKTSESWNHELGKMNHDTTHALTSLEEIAGIPVANVTSTARLKLEVDRSKFPQGGPQVDVRLIKGEVASQVMFDLSRHEAIGRNGVQETIVEARISANGQTMTRLMTETTRGQALRIAEK